MAKLKGGAADISLPTSDMFTNFVYTPLTGSFMNHLQRRIDAYKTHYSFVWISSFFCLVSLKGVIFKLTLS